MTDHTVECPTCRGLGRIKRDDQELLALIPISDSRLRPSKTICYVCAAVVTCLSVGGLLLFFLISRTITLSSTVGTIRPLNITKDQNDLLYIRYQVPFVITNDNFLSVEVSSVSLSSLLYGDQLMNLVTNDTKITVPLRSNFTLYMTVDMVLGLTVDFQQLVKVCQDFSPILWKLPMDFQITAEISYLSHTESSSIKLYNRKVCCHIFHTFTDSSVLDECEQ